MRAAFLPLLIVALSGCIGASTSTGEPTSTGVVWDELVNIAGTLAGPNIVLFSLNPEFAFFNTTAEHDEVVVELASEGGDSTSYIFAPDCDAIECAGRLSARAGETGAWDRASPPPGAWEVHVAKAEPGAQTVGFRLVARGLRAS